MDDAHVCDVGLGKDDALISKRTLSRAERTFGDLFACVTDLRNLKLSEPDWNLLSKDKRLHLRVSLVPRRQLLLDLTIPGQRKLASLEEEAEWLFLQLQRAQIKVTRAARKMIERAAASPFLPDDPVSKMLLKHSRKLYQMQRAGAVAQLEFPVVESSTMDKEPIKLRGIVVLATARRLELDCVSVSPKLGENLSKLIIDRSGLDDSTWHALARIDSVLEASAHLHRCLFTQRVIGASLPLPSLRPKISE